MPTTTLSRPSLALLTRVEVRKMLRTRSGFWLQLGMLAAIVLSVVLTCTSSGGVDQHGFRHAFVNATQIGLIVPVVGILLVTSEWSQRTALTTFALVPHRGRILTAKLAAGLVQAAVATVACLAVAALGAALAGGSMAIPAWLIGQAAILMVATTLMGLGFGALLLASAPAIVVYFVLPLVWSGLGTIKALHGPAQWLDQDNTLSPMTDHVLHGVEWSRAAATVAVLAILPLIAGCVRMLRAEIK